MGVFIDGRLVDYVTIIKRMMMIFLLFKRNLLYQLQEEVCKSTFGFEIVHND